MGGERNAEQRRWFQRRSAQREEVTRSDLAALAIGRGKPRIRSKKVGGRPATRSGKARVNVWIDADLKRWLRMESARSGKDMGEIVEQAVRAHRSRSGAPSD